MFHKNLIIFLCLILLNCTSKFLYAQNINGFEIALSKDQVTSIVFHSKIDNSALLQKNTPVVLRYIGDKTIFLNTEQELKTPYNLIIIEGGRTHKFVITYKDYVDPSEREKDYSDLKQLTKATKEFNEKASASNNQNNSIKVTDKNSSEQQVINSSNDDNSFNALVNEADIGKQKGDLQNAKTKYEKALQIRPNSNYAEAQLQTVNKQIENETNAQYTDIITKANNAFFQNKYDDAEKYYNDALRIRVDDIYAKNQIIFIQKKLNTAGVNEEQQHKENSYNSYVNAGDKALIEKSYNTARMNYNEALKIKPNDVIVENKINSINEKIISDSLKAAYEKNESLYTAFLNAGNKAMEEKAFNEAKTDFNEAMKIKPTDVLIKTKLNDANQHLYTIYINDGDKALKQKLYNKAKDNYNEALKIKLNDAVAQAKLSTVEKQKFQDSLDEVYNNYISSGDKAAGDKAYDIAKAAYSEALKIKPGEAIASAKLENIDEKIIANSLENKRRKDEDLYNTFIGSGDKAIKENAYEEAKNNYKSALAIKPGDAAATAKLNSANNSLFTNLLAAGDKALSNKLYSEAKDIYNQALLLKPNDLIAKTKLNSIETAKTQDSINKAFDTYIISGDKSSNDKSYSAAKIAYSAALKIKPGNNDALSKLATADKKIIADSIATEQNKVENLYTDYIKAGDKAFRQNLYDVAEKNYKNALQLKPDDINIKNKVQKVEDSIASAAIRLKKDSVLNAENNIAAQKVNAKNAEVPNETKNERADFKAVAEIENNMVLIKPQFFKMGSNVGANDESPMHIVEIDSFYIGRYEIMQQQWQAIMSNNPSGFKNCSDCPVENISWNDAMNFIEKLNEISSKKFRLPTEAEWEFVAGTQSKKEKIDAIAWYNENSKHTTHTTGELKPNYSGVYDMFGNVAEWCGDWYDAGAYRNALQNNPTGPAFAKQKVVRGGTWYDMEGAFRVSSREKRSPDKASNKIGFRLAMNAH